MTTFGLHIGILGKGVKIQSFVPRSLTGAICILVCTYLYTYIVQCPQRQSPATIPTTAAAASTWKYKSPARPMQPNVVPPGGHTKRYEYLPSAAISTVIARPRCAHPAWHVETGRRGDLWGRRGIHIVRPGVVPDQVLRLTPRIPSFCWLHDPPLRRSQLPQTQQHTGRLPKFGPRRRRRRRQRRGDIHSNHNITTTNWFASTAIATTTRSGAQYRARGPRRAGQTSRMP